MRILALDVGDRRVGVALSDETGLIARPLAVINRQSKAEDFGEIARLAREWEVCRLVVGLPLDSEGRVGSQARRIQRYVDALVVALKAECADLPVVFWDESGSTRQAQAAMIQAGRRRKDRRARLDAAAAAAILQEYLDAQASRPAPSTQDTTGETAGSAAVAVSAEIARDPKSSAGSEEEF